MKIKRWMVLTALFTFLGGTIVTSGCQTSNTASTTNGGGGVVDIGGCVNQCTQDCTDSCTESCNESCSNCQLGNGTYDCTDPAGCVTCWFDCNLILCTECINGAKNNVTPGNLGGGTITESTDPNQPSEGKRWLVEGEDYTVTFDGITVNIILLKPFNEIIFQLETYDIATGETTGGYGSQQFPLNETPTPPIPIEFICNQQGESKGTHAIRNFKIQGSI